MLVDDSTSTTGKPKIRPVEVDDTKRKIAESAKLTAKVVELDAFRKK